MPEDVDALIERLRDDGEWRARHGVELSQDGSLHHVELWVPDLARARAEWGWLLGQLGYVPFQDWPDGRSWRLGHTYLEMADRSSNQR